MKIFANSKTEKFENISECIQKIKVRKNDCSFTKELYRALALLKKMRNNTNLIWLKKKKSYVTKILQSIFWTINKMVQIEKVYSRNKNLKVVVVLFKK